MKCRDLARLLLETPDRDVYMANVTMDDSGEDLMSNVVDVAYFEISEHLEVWEPRDVDSHVIINPSKLVSG
jgi:hypothetical protein